MAQATAGLGLGRALLEDQFPQGQGEGGHESAEPQPFRDGAARPMVPRYREHVLMGMLQDNGLSKGDGARASKKVAHPLLHHTRTITMTGAASAAGSTSARDHRKKPTAACLCTRG